MLVTFLVAALLVSIVNAIPFQIGHGYDLAELSMWDYASGTTPRTVLTMAGPDIPSACYSKNTECAMAFTKRVKKFDDLHAVFNYFKSSASFGISGGYDGVTASIKAAFGQMSENSWFHDSAGAIGTLTNRRACHSMMDSCLMTGSQEKLDNDFVKSLKQMKTDVTGENTAILQEWVNQIINYRGTHLCTGTDNGAEIKYLSWADASGKAVASCASAKICLGLSYKNYVSVNGCFGQQGCESGLENYISFGSNCAAVGGAGGYASSMCHEDTSHNQQKAFLNSGNTSSTDSVIDMQFMRLDTLLERFDMNTTIVKTMGKAIDYHLCVSQDPDGDVWGWERQWHWTTGWSEPKCVCKRKCENWGQLDETTCTCKCRGNVRHGWMGPTCKQTYGMCQPGDGTGNAAAATHCSTDNWCKSAFFKDYCGPTGVCCLTDFGGTCCPFGSVCNCSHRNCKCEWGRGMEVSNLALADPKEQAASIVERFERLMMQ